MNNRELQERLKNYPDELNVKLGLWGNKGYSIRDANEELFIETSDSDNYDEDGEFLNNGTGERYILFNPIIQ